MRIFVLFIGVLGTCALGADWPTYRADALRTGYSPDELPNELVMEWKRVALQAPRPAWNERERAADDNDQGGRLQFDMVFQPIIAGGMLYFGSSADDTVRAIEAHSGEEKWTYFTGGPVRLAPTFWRGALYVTSDDGFLHCLEAGSGKLKWKLAGSPETDHVLGNGRMISRWPCRGAAVIRDGTVYFGAGTWPSEKTYVIAADAATGKLKWRYCNEVANPKDRDDVQFKFTSQGYPAIASGRLVVPPGRISSYYFDPRDGSCLYGDQDFMGFGNPVIVDGMVFHKSFRRRSAVARDLESNGKVTGLVGRDVTGHADYLLSLTDRALLGHARDGKGVRREVKDERSGKVSVVREIPEPTFKVGMELKEVHEMISCRNKVVIAEGSGVVVVDLETKERKRLEVDAPARGLAVADGRLFVSTEKGTLYCYGTEPGGALVARRSEHPEDPVAVRAAKEIVTKTGVRKGLCIDVAPGTGELALALVRQTDLEVLALATDEAEAESLRRKFSGTGLYGSRLAVIHWPHPTGKKLKWYGDLVVSGKSTTEGTSPKLAVLEPLCSPYIGKGCVGREGSMKVFGGKPLEGAGNWTHMYADSGNTYNSNDSSIKGRLRIRWYTDTKLGLPIRHGRSQQPMIYNGYMIMCGLDGVQAMNAYNGKTFWHTEIPGIMRSVNGWHAGGAGTGGHACVGDDLVFVRVDNACHVLDLFTGKKVAEYETAPVGDLKNGQWGYLAYNNGLLIGSVADPDHVVWGTKDFGINKVLVESKAVFAVDVKSGKRLWTYKAAKSVRNNTIATDGEAVYFVDSPKTANEPLEAGQVLNGMLRERAAKNGTTLKEEVKKYNQRKPGRLLAVVARTGKVKWTSERPVSGTMALVSGKYGRVVVGSNEAYGVWADGGEGGVFDSTTGKFLFEGPGRRPMLNDFDLGGIDIRDGSRLPVARAEGSYAWRVKGCGMSSGSKYFTMLGNGAMRFMDTSVSPPTMQYWAGVKANCWITSIPAGGVVAHGSAGYGCQCNYYTLQATFVLSSTED